jgi:hypothetical protein
MSRSRLLLGLLLASSSLTFLACASPTDGATDDAESQDGELKKKVKPKGGNGAFDLVAPGFDATSFAGTFLFDNTALKPGARSEKVPGTYWLQLQAAGFRDGALMNQQLAFPITAGAIVQHQVGGLRVRFAEPITLGAARVELMPEHGVSAGYLLPGAPWQTSPTGASMLSLASNVTITPATTGAGINAVVAQGALSDVVLPTSHVSLLVDAYDATYPTPACAATLVRAGAQGYATTAPVRNLDGSPNAAFVVPQGPRAPVAVNAFGVEVSQATVAGQTHTFTLNRLEIDDVEVAHAGGPSQFVKGTVTVSYKRPDGSFAGLNCSFPTHSGIDVPDGVYRVASQANTPSGVVTSTEDVTFP